MAIKVGINGFGRIGRTVLRAALNGAYDDVEIVHINDLTDAKTLAHLLKYDSVHGRFDKDVVATDNGLRVGDREITVSAIREPSELPWKQKGVDLVFECTGLFRKREAASKHFEAGASSVLISAPGSGEDITVVYGVNSDQLDKAKHQVISNASCTTNCLAPVMKTIHNAFGVEKAMMTTVHSYTNDQRILDLPHSDLRRARAAAANMIPTSTGAAKAIGLVIPDLKGKVDGMAIRVPTPNVSLVDLTVELKKSATAQDINAALKVAAEGDLKGVMEFCDEPLVSSDFNGSPFSSIVDGPSTAVTGDRMAKILAWYDNETGFSFRMLDVARLLAS